MARKTLGREHPDVATRLNNLAQLLSDQGDYVGAEKLQQEAMDIDIKVHGRDHPDVATDLNNLAVWLESQGNFTGSEKLKREGGRDLEKDFGK